MKEFLSLTFILITSLASAQSKEIGFMLGGSNYHGDLADELVLSETNPCGGVFYRLNFNEFWAYKPMISVMRISGSDENFETNRLRNLNFQSDIIEISNSIELNYEPFSNSPFHNNITAYASLGIAFFYHNPKAIRNGELFELHPMNTENVPLKSQYKLFQMSIPFGGGVKYAITPNFITSFECTWRKTYTDYLDDVSTVYPETSGNMSFTNRTSELGEAHPYAGEPGDMRGNPRFKDWYMHAGITFSYRFTPIQCWATR